MAIEEEIIAFVAKRFENETNHAESVRDLLARKLDRIELRKSCLRLTLHRSENAGPTNGQSERVEIPWAAKPANPIPDPPAKMLPTPKPQLLNAIVRAHAWIKLLNDGIYNTPEDLARGVKLHPNFVRHAIRAAFIDPTITEKVLRGYAGPKLLAKLRQDFGCEWPVRRSPLILTNSYGRPWTSDGFRTSWSKACARAGVTGLTFHDLRGSAVVRLALAEATVPQIATFTGHSLKDVEAILDAHYLGRDVQLAEAAVLKLEKRTKL